MDGNPHLKRLIFYLLLYSAALLAGAYVLRWVIGSNNPVGALTGGVVMFFLAVLPVSIFALLSLRNLQQAAVSLDELQRRMQLDAMAFGFMWACSFTLGMGVLGILYAVHINGFIYFCANLAGWGVGSLLLKWRYA